MFCKASSTGKEVCVTPIYDAGQSSAAGRGKESSMGAKGWQEGREETFLDVGKAERGEGQAWDRGGRGGGILHKILSPVSDLKAQERQYIHTGKYTGLLKSVPARHRLSRCRLGLYLRYGDKCSLTMERPAAFLNPG